MYGFHNVSPLHTAAVGNVRHANLHVFQNKFFIRGRPDLLPALTRKPRARRADKEDGGNPGPSSGRSNLGHDHVDTTRVGHNRIKVISLLQRPMAVRRAQNQQLHDVQPARLGTPLSCPTGTAPKGVGKPSEMTGSGNNDLYSDIIQICPQESTNSTSSAESHGRDTAALVAESTAEHRADVP
ncbi:hypothetical protein HPB48_019578 [Haemaphysalis longicornis]|uniref:Uncharacterized protein n=1 Tax=Haemaphysalis longicornis TaxID=44386 RepID=A0A9J6FF54_HAELO|nr:hypothetical protein HPB48_019578 [Haemaphysalis longicornis]